MAVTLINVFTVPPEQEEAFLAGGVRARVLPAALDRR